jgi:hypothetical protein
MNLRIIFFSLISINFYVFSSYGPSHNYSFQPIPSVVPLTLCDKRYSLEMDKALNAYRNIGNSSARADLIKVAEEYMILVKHQQDLDITIRSIEAKLFNRTIGMREKTTGYKLFNLDEIRILRRPLELYIRCKDNTDRGLGDNSKYGRSFEVNSKIPTITRLGYPAFTAVGPCDHLYSINMEKALDDIKSVLKTDLIKTAEEYMVLIKQEEDVDLRIRQLELRVFSSSVINILRRPIAEYVKCRDSLRTGTFSINFYR